MKVVIIVLLVVIGGAVGVHLFLARQENYKTSSFAPIPLYTTDSESTNVPSPTHSLKESESYSQNSTANTDPRISNVFPNPIAGGQIIIVSGRGFGSTSGTVKLSGPEPFTNGYCPVKTWSPSEIHCTLPNNMVAGSTHSVQVVTTDGAQSPQRNLSIE